jgi:hypothetical protein
MRHHLTVEAALFSTHTGLIKQKIPERKPPQFSHTGLIIQNIQEWTMPYLFSHTGLIIQKIPEKKPPYLATLGSSNRKYRKESQPI